MIDEKTLDEIFDNLVWRDRVTIDYGLTKQKLQENGILSPNDETHTDSKIDEILDCVRQWVLAVPKARYEKLHPKGIEKTKQNLRKKGILKCPKKNSKLPESAKTVEESVNKVSKEADKIATNQVNGNYDLSKEYYEVDRLPTDPIATNELPKEDKKATETEQESALEKKSSLELARYHFDCFDEYFEGSSNQEIFRAGKRLYEQAISEFELQAKNWKDAFDTAINTGQERLDTIIKLEERIKDLEKCRVDKHLDDKIKEVKGG